MNVDAQPVARALNLYTADRSTLELPVEVLANMDVLDQVVLVIAVGEPPRLPVGGSTQAEPVRVYLLTH